MEANFIVAISTGFAGAILFSVISEGKSFKEFIGNCIFSFIGFGIIGFIVGFLAKG